jgi:hypothetical protein
MLNGAEKVEDMNYAGSGLAFIKRGFKRILVSDGHR